MACGRTLELGRFCPECGAEQRAVLAAPKDPLIGRIICDRYEILDLINVGGMGGVYRARHRALDRIVAVKFVHPHLLTAEDVATRFMIEAQTASRLNHPNVVSIYDFGRTPPDEDGRLFLVMEFLSGPDLATVYQREGLLSLSRIARVIIQMLAALSEAHQLGIVHRDIKPENIILEPRRTGDHVKLIDFGIAKPDAGRRLTAEGRVMGTPVYMAPEQTMAEEAGASVDLYAVGVILFQLLAGRVPFDGATPESIMLKQRSAERPDPRALCPVKGRIPDELAALCLRAIAIDQEARFATAEAFSEAIEAVMPASLPAPRIGAPPPPKPRTATLMSARVPLPATGPEGLSREQANLPEVATSLPSSAIARAQTPAHDDATPSHPRRWPLVGRDEELAWVRAELENETATGLLLWGREGSGRSRLLADIIRILRDEEAAVPRMSAPPYPLGEVSYAGLRGLVELLIGGRPGESSRTGATGAAGHAVWDGLRIIYSERLSANVQGGSEARAAVIAAVRWAVAAAVTKHAPRRVVLAIDDVDQLDRVSRIALGELLNDEPTPGFKVLCTGARQEERWARDRVPSREMRGLSADDVRALLGDERLLERRRDWDDVEPLFLQELVGSGAPPHSEEQVPETLAELVEQRLRAVTPEELRTLQTIAVLGRTTREALLEIGPHASDIDLALPSLLESGLVEQRAGGLRIRHGVVARTAVALAPRGAVSDVHARTAEVLSEGGSPLELCAHHAIRGRPDFASFLLMDDCARLRQLHGDDDGAIAMLWDGLSAAHTQALLGETEATEAWIAFGKKLGAALLGASRGDEAMGVLNEVLDQAGPRGIERAHVLAQLADIAAHRKRVVEAETRRLEALAIAERMGDLELAERLRRSSTPTHTSDFPYSEPPPESMNIHQREDTLESMAQRPSGVQMSRGSEGDESDEGDGTGPS